MKTLVISAIIAMTSLVNVVSAVADNRVNKFAYNTETSEGRVETKTVFKVESNKFLHRHLKYNYIYDNSGRISQKEVLKWNEATQSFEKHHSLNFFYTDDVTVEYALWNLTADHHLTNESVQLFLFLRHWGRPGSPVPEVVFPGAEPLAPRFRRNIFDTYQLFFNPISTFYLYFCTGFLNQ